MSVERLAQDLDSSLKALGDASRAEHERSYLKSRLTHYGASVPKVRAAAKAFAVTYPDLGHDPLLRLVEVLWAAPIHERRLVAIELLTVHQEKLTAEDIVVVERFLRQAGTWALVDPLAVSVVGDLAERFPQLGAVLDRWASDDHIWMRRAALLALLKPLRGGHGDFDRFAGYAEAMLEDKEFFVQKAIGWVLRETAKKRPSLVAEWLVARAARVSAVTIREAMKPLSVQERASVLAARRR